jgi:Uma2 family endonuclease
MPTTTTPAEEHQERWQTIVNDPLLSKLPYKVETNRRGQIVLSPHSAEHSDLQGDLIALLSEHAGDGRARPEFPIATPAGTKVADVIWVTATRREEMQATGDPPTLAPEICVEVMSASNDWEEMDEKRRLYREAGAEEVWVVAADGSVRFFADDELERSELAPDFPQSI